MKTYQSLLITLSVLIFAGCTVVPSTNSPTDNQPSRQDTQVPSNTASENPIVPINTPDSSEITPPAAELNPFVLLAEEDLASRLAIHREQIHFLKISDIDWQDISQGCTTSAGQTLTKGRVSGYRIWLEAEGKDYLYHIGLDQTILPCTNQP